MGKHYHVKHERREVIEGQLLLALEDKESVAAILTREDINVLLTACSHYIITAEHPSREDIRRIKSIKEGLFRLRELAFD